MMRRGRRRRKGRRKRTARSSGRCEREEREEIDVQGEKLTSVVDGKECDFISVIG